MYPADVHSPRNEGTPESGTLHNRLSGDLPSGIAGGILQFDWPVLEPLQGIYLLGQLDWLSLFVCVHVCVCVGGGVDVHTTKHQLPTSYP